MSKSRVIGVVLIVGAVLLGTVLAIALYQWDAVSRSEQAPFLPSPNPLAPEPTPTPLVGGGSAPNGSAAPSEAAGARVFAGKCTACHPNGNAGVGPALHGPQFIAKFPRDEPLKQVIRDGRGGMPAYPPTVLSDVDLASVIAFLRSLP